MASAELIAKLKTTSVPSKLQLLIDNTDYTVYISRISEIRRDVNLTPGSVTLTLNNPSGIFDIFYTDASNYGKKVVINYLIGGVANYAAVNTISFHENTPSRDTIEDSADGFIAAGIKAGMVLAISGSEFNNKNVTVESVTAGVITLIPTDELTSESAGWYVHLINEYVALFTGYTDDVTLDYKNKQVTITARDRLSLALENKVQLDQGTYPGTPEAINWIDNQTLVRGNPMILSDIVWYLLITYAKLDATGDAGNPDIDWDSWVAWAEHVDDGGYDGYDLNVVADGESVKVILLKIAYLTESRFWIGGAGKIKFIGSLQTEVTGQSYKAELLSVITNVSLKGRINSISCKWGYTYVYDDFLSDTSGLDTDSAAHEPTAVPYTYQTELIDDRIVSHNQTTSSSLFMLEKLARTAGPIKTFDVVTNRLGFIEDIGNIITLKDIYSDPEVHIDEIVFNPNSWTVSMKGWEYWVVV
jgi:hypothetical protein